ncbi:redox-regulated ATPase YchF [Candidatus Daviesbacteria bacterium]|nr:redox-regulated ATPase YchF [Candidatus Daviesbacteria bacterium]
MSLKVGIVGLPNVGKSTLFNALLKKRVALSANYPFATVEPNIGVVAVPDERLEKLAELVKAEEKMSSLPPLVPAVVEFVDIAGLVKGAAQGAGLGNQFLSHIREVDAIIHVLRDFEDPNVVKAGAENPDSDKSVVETELGLADLQTLEKLTSDKTLDSGKLNILKKIKEQLNLGNKITQLGIGDTQLNNWFTHLPLLSIKPVLYVYNVSEENYGQISSDRGKNVQANELVISAKLEEELADLSEEERKQYLKELGIEQTGLERLIQTAYKLLGLISFLTAGPKEVRAWTIKKGTRAPQAAGVIHTDFEKNFIRAQVISYDELLVHTSQSKAKEAGKVRTEGKDYEIRDGDVVEFLVST